MANIAECAIRVAVDDLPKITNLIRQVEKGTEPTYIIEAFYAPAYKAPMKYKLVLKGSNAYTAVSPKPDQVDEAYELVKGKKKDEWKPIDVKTLPTKEYECYGGRKEMRLDLWYMASDTIDWTEVFVTGHDEYFLLNVNEAYRLSGYWPSIVETTWAELGTKTLELVFQAKWDFPSELETALNKVAIDEDGATIVAWQGAMSEPGMGAYTDKLGTEDLGLCIDWEAICPECYDTIEECIEDGKDAEDYTCPNCKDDEGKPLKCYEQSYVSSYITNSGKQWKEKK